MTFMSSESTLIVTFANTQHTQTYFLVERFGSADNFQQFWDSLMKGHYDINVHVSGFLST